MSSPQARWLSKLSGHPKGLLTLCVVEMFGRFAFYMLLGVLVLYVSDTERGGLGLSTVDAMRLYGAYVALVFFTPVFGGALATKWLGLRVAILAGGMLFAMGLALVGSSNMTCFYLGLGLLCLGNGLSRPSVSLLLGNLYRNEDQKRDAGFNILFVFINTGAAIGFLAAGPVRNLLSWHWVFWCAAIAIAIALVVFVANWTSLKAGEFRVSPDSEPRGALADFSAKLLLTTVATSGIGYALSVVVKDWPLPRVYTAAMFGIVPVIAFFLTLPVRVSKEERPAVLALLMVFLTATTFFAVLHMHGSALNIWAARWTDRQVRWVPDAWKQGAEPSYFENSSSAVPRPDPRSFLGVDDSLKEALRTKTVAESQMEQLPLGPSDRAITIWDTNRGVLDGRRDTTQQSESVYAVYRDQQVENGRPMAGERPVRKIVFVRVVDGHEVPLTLALKNQIAKVYEQAGPSRLGPGEALKVVVPELYQTWNPIWVIALSPIVIAFFRKRESSGAAISTARKMFYGLVFTTFAMLLMEFASWFYKLHQTRVSGMWLVGTYSVITLGELCLSPMGLSIVTKLAPARLAGVMMGGWFGAMAIGNGLSGILGEAQSSVSPWLFFLLVTIAVGAVTALFWKLLPRLEQTMP